MRGCQNLYRSVLGCRENSQVKYFKTLTSKLWSKSVGDQTRSFSTSDSRHLRIGIQGAEVYRGQRKAGVELGPKTIRDTGVISGLQSLGHDVLDYGNVPVLELQEEHLVQQRLVASVGRTSQTVLSSDDGYLNVKYAKQVADTNKLISEWTTRILSEGRICVTLGGDHALGIGTVNGASQIHHDLAVLWVDAHSDINTPLTSDTGSIHGMPVAFFVKELQPYMPQLPEFAWVEPRIKASNMAFIALRDVDPAERAILEMLGITAFSMREVDRFGIQKVTEMALSKVSQDKQRPIHVSFDIDSLCESIIKSTGTPVPGGLTLREGITLLEMIHDTGSMVSMDLVEVNPLLGSEKDVESTAKAAKHLLLSAFGNSRGGMVLNSIPKP